MDSDQGKLFVGGIPWETSDERLKEYFKAYGEVVETVIMKDRATGRSRGFGFVVFADAAVVDRVLQEKHTIDGRTVEAKKAVPRDEQQNAARSNLGAPLPAGQIRTKKIFVGGLASTVTEEDFRKYFAEFGTITDVVVMYDHNTQRPRGFGFITYDSEDAVDKVLQKPFHELNEKMVEVKRAVPKELSAGSDRSSGGVRGAGYGATYGQGFSSSPGGGGYGARPDGRYGPVPAGRGMYPYAAPAYGAGGYGGNAGYGAGMNGGYTGAGYGAGAPYGSATAGPYGSAYTTAPPAGGYGTAAGYGAPASAQMGGRSGWGGGGATGYGPASGSATYGTGAAGYGSGASWGSAPAGAQPTVSSGGYGYGTSEAGYGSTDAGYGSKSAGYGTGATSYGGTGAAGGGGGNYPGNYGGMYGSTGYGEGAFPSAGGVAGGAASGGYGLGTAGTTDGTVNGPSGYGGSYGAAGRQTPKGPDTRFRPYPASGDRSS